MAIIFRDHDWFLAITRNMSFWHQCLSGEAHFHHSRDFGVEATLRQLYISETGTHTSVFMFQPNYGEYVAAVMNAVRDEASIRELQNRYETLADQLRIAVNELVSDFGEKNLEKFFNSYRPFCAGLMITATLGRAGGEQLAVLLKDHGISEEKIDETIATITYPQHHTPLFQSQLDLLTVAAAIQSKSLAAEAVERKIQLWLETYGHIPVNFCEDPWGLKDVQAQLEQLLTTDCGKAYADAEAGHTMRVANAQARLTELNDSTITNLAHAVAEGTYLNEYRKNMFSWVSLAYRPAFQKIALLGGSSDWRDCFYFTPAEMLACVRGDRFDLESLKTQRALAGAYIDDAGIFALLSETETQLFYQSLKSSHQAPDGDAAPVKTLKGFAASAGKITGTVKVVLSSKDFDKVLAGDILVATMTSVDFVPVMARAAAFITNEGGITCHASIVAREMGKPCIIGTKIATRVFQDGDLVEVNADKGIATLIKRD